MPDYEIIEVNGVERHLGLLPTPTHIRKLYKAASDVVPSIPESQWQEIYSRNLVRVTLNQGNQGACVGFSGVQAVMIARERIGLPFVELSGGSLYGQINGGRDSGANLGDALIALQQVGCTSAETIAQSDWRSAYRMSLAAQAEAANYRIDERYVCKSVDEFFSGIQLGFAGQWGVSAGGSFSPDSQGYVPGSRGDINHAVVGCGMHKDTRGQWWLEAWNSLGSNWGLNGRFFYPIDSVAEDENWLIRSTIIAP